MKKIVTARPNETKALIEEEFPDSDNLNVEEFITKTSLSYFVEFCQFEVGKKIKHVFFRRHICQI